MKEELKMVLWYTFLVVVVITIFTVVFTALNGSLYPWWLSIQRKSVESSKSFTDSNNVMLVKYIQDYSNLDTKIAEANGNNDLVSVYKSQQTAIVNLMCTQISTMKTGTVNPNTISWLASKGGCK